MPIIKFAILLPKTTEHLLELIMQQSKAINTKLLIQTTNKHNDLFFSHILIIFKNKGAKTIIHHSKIISFLSYA